MVASNAGVQKREEFVAARFVDHPSFHEKGASVLYRINAGASEGEASAASHLPDDVTRELAKRMHFAAFRLSRAGNSAEARTWRSRLYRVDWPGQAEHSLPGCAAGGHPARRSQQAGSPLAAHAGSTCSVAGVPFLPDLALL